MIMSHKFRSPPGRSRFRALLIVDPTTMGYWPLLPRKGPFVIPKGTTRSVWVGTVVVVRWLSARPAIRNFIARVLHVAQLLGERTRWRERLRAENVDSQTQAWLNLAGIGEVAQTRGIDQPRDDLGPLDAILAGAFALGEQEQRPADFIFLAGDRLVQGEIKRDADFGRADLQKREATVQRSAIELAESELVVAALERVNRLNGIPTIPLKPIACVGACATLREMIGRVYEPEKDDGMGL